MGPILTIKLLFSMVIIKGIFHSKMKMLCLSAYPKMYPRCSPCDFVSSVEHKQRFKLKQLKQINITFSFLGELSS